MPTNRRFAGGISLTAAERGGEEAYSSDVLKYVQMSSIEQMLLFLNWYCQKTYSLVEFHFRSALL